ncbi:MAG: type II toxin-antitoxin system prevent-host-death family antitoxin [Vicinamibacterales bacterium]|nr:type II toxin-antitoxin system prevent-host-death family antitoxin [Vicinamibacterales bacterium]
MTMITVNINEAKARLSHYLALVAAGESVVICKHNRPVAELRAVAVARIARRPFGLAAGSFEVPDSFFEPLLDEDVDSFYGVEAGEGGSAMHVAESGVEYGPPASTADDPPSSDEGRRQPTQGKRRS